MSTKIPFHALLIFLVAWPLTAEVEQPTQITLFDLETDWVRTTLIKALEQPDDWNASGRDFLNGEHYVRLEVIEKPTDIEVMAHVCFWQGINETCAGWGSLLSFRRAGVYYAKVQAPYAQWALREEHRGDRRRFDGTGKLSQALLQWWVRNPRIRRGWSVLRTFEKGGVGAGLAEGLGPEAFAHIPIRYRIEYIVVAKGHTFVVPTRWTSAPAVNSDDWNYYGKHPEFVVDAPARPIILRSDSGNARGN